VQTNNIILSFVAIRLHSYEYCSESLGQGSAIAERVLMKPDYNGSFHNNSIISSQLREYLYESSSVIEGHFVKRLKKRAISGQYKL